MNLDVKQISQEIEKEFPLIERLRSEIGRVVFGQETMIDSLIVALLCNQHVLLEGVPGLAKTLAVTSLAQAVHATFSRIQFTPDLLPADVIGTLIYNPKTGDFYTRKGPVFANIVLADEINRAPAKVQSALLEAMQERQVTIGDETLKLDDPFLVLATQNPVEQEGTYPLPEAQVDRFMLKIVISYPSRDDELKILRQRARSRQPAGLEQILEPADIIRLRGIVDEIYMDARIEEYIVNLVEATRYPEKYELNLKHLIHYGASPRATIFLAMAARARAFLQGRGYVTPQDVKDMAPAVLRHRVIVTYEAEAEEKTSDDVVKEILAHVEVP